MKNILTWCSATLMALSLVACGGEDSGGPSQPDGGDNGGNTVVISELQVTPANSHIPVGFEQQLTAEAHMSDGSVIDVTANPSVSWSSSDVSIATIDNKGLVTGVKVGTATMKASGTNASGQHFEATAQVEVTSATVTGLQVTPATASVPAGFTQEYVATALLSDGSTLDVTQFTGLTWSSSDAATASISNDGATKGLASGLKAGVVTITASGSANGQQFSESAELTVTNATPTQLVVTPATASVPMGLSQQYLATLTLSDGTTRDVTADPALSWSSSSTAVATISNESADKGLATGVTAGTATITASGTANGTPFSATAELTVTNAIVTALRIDPTTATVPMGLTQQFTALATLSDGSTRDVTADPALSWSSSDATIATISSTDGDKGLATGVKTGGVTITAFGTAASGQTFNATAELTVTSAVATELVVTPNPASTPAGLTKQFLATLTLSDGTTRDVTHEPALSWSSSDVSVATISSSDPDKGLATGVTPGIVTITASGSAGGTPVSATAELTVTNAIVTALQVTPATAEVGQRQSQPFTAMATFSDGQVMNVTNQAALSWSSSDTAIATITSSQASANGVATGVSPGVVTITASGSNNGTAFSATAQLTVKPVSNVVTWGRSDHGGDSSLIREQLIDVQFVSATNQAFAALKQDGAVVAWGNPATGGDSSAVQDQLINVRAVFTTTYGAFAALKQDGSVVTWGGAAYGGDSSAVQGSLTNVKTIFSNGYAFAALKQDGSVVTWGGAAYGGDSSVVQGQLTSVQAIFHTEAAFAALKQDGSVVTWGSTGSGGDSTAVQDQLTNVQAIKGNKAAFAALKQDGTVVTWGSSGNGGNSSAVQGQLTGVQTIFSAFQGAFAALKQDGSVVTWGSASYGGDSAAVQGQLTDVQVIFSNDNAFAALKQDGSLVVWGNASNGGDASAVQDQLTSVRTVTGNAGAFAALKQDGTVAAWGSANGGDSSLVQDQLTNVQTIFSNNNAFAALKQDGTVVSWGKADYGGDSSGVQDQLINVQLIFGNATAFAALISP